MKDNYKKHDNSICIYGGSFDPVTNAHMAIIKHLSTQFNKVIVVPSFISPFKKQGAVVGGDLRLEMLNAAIVDRPNVIVSDYEVAKGDTSYTIDTVRHFKNQYPNQNLFFALGSEMLKKLPKWHEFDSLKILTNFYVLNRVDASLAPALLKRLTKKLEVNLEISDFVAGNEASALARIDIAFGNFKSIPKAAASIIKKQNLYNDFDYIVKALNKFDLLQERIDHIYGTTTMAVNLAKKHNSNIADITLAALLHDIAKEVQIDKLIDMGVKFSAPPSEFPLKVQHAFIGADVAKQIFGIKKKSVLDAIRYHTTGAPKMGKLAKLLFIADFCDFCKEGRDGTLYADVRAEVRAEPKINKAVALILKTKIKHIESKGSDVYPLTMDAYAHFLSLTAPKIKAESMVNEAIAECDSLKALMLQAQDTISEKGVISEKEGQDFKDKASTNINIEKSKDLNKPNNVSPLSLIPSPLNKNHLAYKIAKILDDKKGRDITIIDLTGKTIIADYFVIASAFSTTAVRALTDIVDEELSKKMGIEPLRRDIDPNWACVDYGDVILHVQLEETRDFYNLERLWANGDNITRL